MTSVKSRLFQGRLWLAGALIAAALSPVQAEPTRKVRIRLSGQCDWVGNSIRVVVDGNETQEFEATRDASGGFWTGQSAIRFNAAKASASLRLASARTDCQASRLISEGVGRWVAEFTFTCDKQTVQDIEVHAEPESFEVTYVREVPKIRKGPDIPCTEVGMFKQGKGTIADVHFATESVRLQAGWASPKPDSPGLFIDQPAVLKRANRAGDVQLTLDTFLDALTEQRSRGKLSPPILSGSARDAERKRLAELELEQIELKGLQRKE